MPALFLSYIHFSLVFTVLSSFLDVSCPFSHLTRGAPTCKRPGVSSHSQDPKPTQCWICLAIWPLSVWRSFAMERCSQLLQVWFGIMCGITCGVCGYKISFNTAFNWHKVKICLCCLWL